MLPGIPKLPKITSLLFLCNILRRNWVIKLSFCIQISMKACYKLIGWFWPGCSSIPKVPKKASLQCLCNISKEKLNMKFPKSLFQHFGYQSFLQGRYYHYQWARLSIFKSLKVTSLQYLYNISKKKLGMEVIFGMQINVKASTGWYHPFGWKWPDMFKIPQIGSW